jgi:hypothetical protein
LKKKKKGGGERAGAVPSIYCNMNGLASGGGVGSSTSVDLFESNDSIHIGSLGTRLLFLPPFSFNYLCLHYTSFHKDRLKESMKESMNYFFYLNILKNIFYVEYIISY